MNTAALHLTAGITSLKRLRLKSFVSKLSKQGLVLFITMSLIPSLYAETVNSSLSKSEWMMQMASTMRYMDNPNISRADKIQKFWQEYSSSTGNTKEALSSSKNFSKEMAKEGLESLSPTNLIPEFIEGFNTKPADRRDYLDLIISGLQVQPKSLSADDLQKVIEAQNFLKQQVQIQDDPDLLSTIISAYNDSTPYSEEKAELINTALNRLAALTKVDPQSLFREKFELDINDVSGKSLNQLIGNLENSKYRDSFIKLVGAEIGTGLNAKMLSAPNQKLISQYLLQQIQQDTDKLDASKDINWGTSMKVYDLYDLIKQYGAFTNYSDYLANAILSTQNPNLQAAFIMAALDDPRIVNVHKIIKANQNALTLHLKKRLNADDLSPPSVIFLSSDPHHMNAQDKAKVDALLLRRKKYSESGHAPSIIPAAINQLNKLQ